MTDISQKTFDKIKKEGVCPTPTWRLLLLRCIPISIVAMGVALAGAALAAAMYWTMDHDLQAMTETGPWWFVNILAHLPYFWLVSSGLGLVLAYVAFRATKFGYRYRVLVLLTVAFVSAGAVAGLFHLAGMDATLKLRAPDVLPVIRKVTEEKCMFWNQPSEGLLGGRVTGQDDTGLVLEDASGTSWYVTTTATTPGLEYAQFLQSVRVVGEKAEDGRFIAKEIRPWAYQVPNQAPAPNDNTAGPCKGVERK